MSQNTTEQPAYDEHIDGLIDQLINAPTPTTNTADSSNVSKKGTKRNSNKNANVSNRASPNIAADELNSKVLIEILRGLKYLRTIDDRVINLQMSLNLVKDELINLKNDVAINKQAADRNKEETCLLRKENKLLNSKILFS